MSATNVDQINCLVHERDEAICQLWRVFSDLSDVLPADDWTEADLGLWSRVTAHAAVQERIDRANASLTPKVNENAEHQQHDDESSQVEPVVDRWVAVVDCPGCGSPLAFNERSTRRKCANVDCGINVSIDEVRKQIEAERQETSNKSKHGVVSNGINDANYM